MYCLKPEVLDRMRKQYPKGTRVELVSMNDPQAPPVGTQGTVDCIDDTGSVFVNWDNGSGLALLYRIDSFKVVEKTGS